MLTSAVGAYAGRALKSVNAPQPTTVPSSSATITGRRAWSRSSHHFSRAGIACGSRSAVAMRSGIDAL